MDTARSLFDGTTAGARRARATLAHEAGHGLLHAVLFAEDVASHRLFDGHVDPRTRRIMCRDEDLRRRSGGYDGKWWEWQANQTIGGLLLPRRLLEMVVEPVTCKTGQLGTRRLCAESRDRAVQELATVFDVNPVVAKIRLSELLPQTGQLFL